MKEWTRLQQLSDKLEATAEARIEVQGAAAAPLAQSIGGADDLAIPGLATVSPGQIAPNADKDKNMPPAKEKKVDKEHKQKVKAKKRNYAEPIASSSTTGHVEEETKVAHEWLDCLLNDIGEAKKLALQLSSIKHQSELVSTCLLEPTSLRTSTVLTRPRSRGSMRRR